MRRVIVQEAAFDLGALTTQFTMKRSDAGAVVTFSGIVRGDDELQAMEIEHYPAMTERALAGIREEAISRWELVDALVVHRHGRMVPGELIMMVATAARHRGEAFAAAEFVMDYLKSRAPFWKKEHRPDGASWVVQRDADEAALGKWASSPNLTSERYAPPHGGGRAPRSCSL